MDVEQFLPLMCEDVNSFLRRKAETELNEDESEIESEIQKLKNMIDKKDLPCQTNDAFLLWFLRAKKHQVKRAFDQLQKYSFRRHDLMKYYGFLDQDKIRVAIETGVVGVLPKRDEQGRAVIFIRAGAWDSSVCSADDALRATLVLCHFCLEYPASQISGFSFVFDNHLSSIGTLVLFLKYTVAIAPAINAFPARFQHIAFVNNNVLLRSIAPVLLSVLPSNLKKRTKFYGDAKTALPEIFHPSILPEEFGGTLGPINALYREWIESYQQYVPKIRATNKYYRRKNTIEYPDDTGDIY